MTAQILSFPKIRKVNQLVQDLKNTPDLVNGTWVHLCKLDGEVKYLMPGEICFCGEHHPGGAA